MAQFGNLIDELDEETLREFHHKLLENRCYEGLLNISEIDEGSVEKLRDAVKVGVQGADYEKLKEIGPVSIRKEIETIETKSATPKTSATLQDIEEPETKEKLIQELMQIVKERVKGIGVPESLRPRYVQILKILTEIHGMTYQDIEDATHITRKSVAKALENYRKEHPIVKPDEKVLGGAEKEAQNKLTKVVGATADKIIEDDMELAIHIRQTYLKEAYMRGMSLRELVDTAVSLFFKTGDIYTLFIDLEREALELRDSNERLEAKVARLTTLNKNLSHVLTSGISGG